MRKYEVVMACYVPVGPGLKWKKLGQVVTLDDADAGDLAGFVVPVGGSPSTPPRRKTPRRKGGLDSGVQGLDTLKTKGVAKRNTPKAKGDTPEVESHIAKFDSVEEVDSDAGKPGEVASRDSGEDH